MNRRRSLFKRIRFFPVSCENKLLIMALKAGVKAGFVGENILKLIRVDSGRTGDWLDVNPHVGLFVEKHGVSIVGIQADNDRIDLAIRQLELQEVVASDKVARAGHGEKLVAAKLAKDGGSDLTGHLGLSLLPQL